MKTPAEPKIEHHQKLEGRLPSLDGWRGISILLVLGSHTMFCAGFPEKFRDPFRWIFDGNLGVRFFFLISGFLITWLLLAEAARHGKIDIKSFYIRRSLRILPVYFAFLAILALLQAFTPYTQSLSAWLGNLTFTTNFVSSSFTAAHLWSLATEEQFYFIWPAILIWLNLASNSEKAFKILAIAVVLAPISRVMGYTRYPEFLAPFTAHFSFFSFFDSIAIGCATAILLKHRYEWIERYPLRYPKRSITAGLLLILFPHVLTRLQLLSPLTVPFGPSSQALGFSILLILSLLLPRWGIFRVLNWKWLTRVGVLSYSIYIWQNIFCTSPKVFGLDEVWWMSYPGWLIPVAATALISYYCLEQPFMKMRNSFRKP